MRRLPNLKTLRVFEAVARCKSFTAAAEELYIGQSAVSHQIKQLEEYLRLPVFVRKRYGVELTNEGKLLFATCSRLFDDLAETVDHILPHALHTTLRVKVGPFFSMKLIAPRISVFIEQNPGLKVHLSHVDSTLATQNIPDIIINYGNPNAGDCFSVELMHERLVPVCSPSFFNKGASALELLSSNRLHYRDLTEWQQWIKSSSLQLKRNQLDIIFDDQHVVLEAVKVGQGVGLIDRVLVEEDIRSGQLRQIHEHYYSPPERYYFSCTHNALETKPVIKKILHWLQSEIKLKQNRLNLI